MSAFENAAKSFHACEMLKGWDECKQYVASDASFCAQCEPLVDIDTVRKYVEWMTSFGKITAAGCSYELHATAYNEDSRAALFFATFKATHVGEGGPVPPTNKETQTHYVYVLQMDTNDRVAKM